MTTPTTDRKLGDLVAETPRLAALFDRMGLEYCCGGDRTLQAACAERGLDAPTVAGMLAALASESIQTPEVDAAKLGLPALVDHLEDTHHRYLRAELPRLAELLEKVVAAHGAKHPELTSLQASFGDFRQEIVAHLVAEENGLFPAVRSMSGFADLDGQVAALTTEHEGAGEALATFRRLTADYTLPADACATFAQLYEGLKHLEHDLHRHVHKENNILFPRLQERLKEAS